MSDEDGDLLIRARIDSTAFGEFYRRNRDPLLAWLYREVMCPEVAADLAAETFATALEKLERFSPQRGTGRAWLWGIAGIQLRRWWRRGAVANRAQRRLGIPPLVVDDEAVAHIERLVDLEPAREALGEALTTLSQAERNAVELRVIKELSYDETATALGCTTGAARVRVSRGLAKLRENLTQEREDLSPWERYGYGLP